MAQAIKKTAEKMTPRQRFIVEGNVFADADAKLGADLDGVVIAEAVASDKKQERERERARIEYAVSRRR